MTHPLGDKTEAEPVAQAEPAEPVVRIDRERMQRALESETHAMPSGLSREEKRQRILAVARQQQ